jgi:hypothetical protein
VQFDRRKLAALIVRVAETIGPADVGAVKLHKVAYLADMLAWLDRGRPITGATYRKRPHGPTCDDLPGILRELERDGAVEVRRRRYFGFEKIEVHVTGGTAQALLDDYECALIDEIADFVCRRNTARTISEFTHDGPWRLVEFGDEIPYETSELFLPVEDTEQAMAWALGEGAEGEDPRSATNPVDLHPYGSLRGRLAARLQAVSV